MLESRAEGDQDLTYRLQQSEPTSAAPSSAPPTAVGANVFAGEAPLTRRRKKPKRDTKRKPASPQSGKSTKRRGGWRESLLFPTRGEAFWTVSALALVYGILVSGFLPAAIMVGGLFIRAAVLVVGFFCLAYFFHTLLQVLRVAASGEEDMPLAMDWDVDELLGDFGLALGCLLMGLGPWVGYHGYLAWTSGASQPWIEWLLIGYAIVYLPMATLIVGLYQSVWSANPVSVLWAVLKVPGEYLTTCLFLAGVGALAFGVETVVGSIPFLGSILSWWVAFAGGMAAMHQLGTLYHRRRRRFGWFPE